MNIPNQFQMVPNQLIVIPDRALALIPHIRTSRFEYLLTSFFEKVLDEVAKAAARGLNLPPWLTVMAHAQFHYNETQESVDSGILVNQVTSGHITAVFLEESKAAITDGLPTLGMAPKRRDAFKQLIDRLEDDRFRERVVLARTRLLWAITAIGLRFAIWQLDFDTNIVYRLQDAGPALIERVPLNRTFPEEDWGNAIDEVMTDQFLLRALSVFRERLKDCLVNLANHAPGAPAQDQDVLIVA